MKVAIVHDYLNQYGGGERMLEVLCEMFPRAPIYTLLYDEKATGFAFRNKEVHVSFLQKVPFISKNHRMFPALMPIAIEQFDLSYFDVVISNSASFGKGVITKPRTKHICLCMTPTRFLWGGSHKFVDEFNYSRPIKKIIPFLSAYLRTWDLEASARPDRYVAISGCVKERIRKYYGRQSEIINPPVDTGKFNFNSNGAGGAEGHQKGEYFLMVGRLVPYKKFDLAVETFNNLGLPLKIIGDGPEMGGLRKMAKKNIEFVGLVSDYKMPEYYRRAKAVVFPQEEDFGIVPIEAMASGRPVLAYNAGGAAETVLDGVTGIFFNEQTSESLAEAARSFNEKDFSPVVIRNHALNFDKKIFKQKFLNFIEELW